MPFNFPPFPPPRPREAAMACSCFSSWHLLTEHQATARWAGGGVPTLTFWKTFSQWGGEERTVTRFVIFSSLATKNPGLSTRWGGRGGRGSGAGRLQTPIKVFYWISTSGSRRQGGPGAGAGLLVTRTKFNIINTWQIHPELKFYVIFSHCLQPPTLLLTQTPSRVQVAPWDGNSRLMEPRLQCAVLKSMADIRIKQIISPATQQTRHNTENCKIQNLVKTGQICRLRLSCTMFINILALKFFFSWWYA